MIPQDTSLRRHRTDRPAMPDIERPLPASDFDRHAQTGRYRFKTQFQVESSRPSACSALSSRPKNPYVHAVVTTRIVGLETRSVREHGSGNVAETPSVSAIYTQPEKLVSSQRVGVRPKSICPRFVPADAPCGKPGREGCSNLSAGSEGQMPSFASPTATRRAPGRAVRVPMPTSGMRHRGPRGPSCIRTPNAWSAPMRPTRLGMRDRVRADLGPADAAPPDALLTTRARSPRSWPAHAGHR
ncbi:hypothetical protein LKMONMHP_3655 [Methylobacterium organophilum]|uniref:Uncharacterized protein n=1 Tax=Methylobacterium organophilum TaxID=410 RepID=A0ABQ4TCJ6_METOR|nr:hypothetical protein LKMONMHP_3655 [Methylobacterium organophilum]